MRQAGRLEKLESGQGSPVDIAGWCDLSGTPFEPDAEMRAYVEQEAYHLQPDHTDWRWAVRIPDELVDAIIVLLGERGRIQLIEINPYSSLD